MSALRAKIAAARAVGTIARATGRGGGTSLPGKLLLTLEPDAISQLSTRLRSGSAVISATNGKTTTAAMAASILSRAGHTLVHNRAGANMAGGVASTLLAAARPHGGMAGDLGLFELDEFWLDKVTDELLPRAVVLGNLFRDQLDRYGELESIGARWASVCAGLPPTTALILCADDPLVADLGRGLPNVTYFGLDDSALAATEMQHAADSKLCRNCGAPYRYDSIYLAHLGDYHCDRCGQRRPTPAVSARDVRLHGTQAVSFTLVTPRGSHPVELPLPGIFNLYNSLAAASLALALGVSLEETVLGLEHVSAAFGRAEVVSIGASTLQLLLIKNPAGANEVIRTLLLEATQLDVLAILNDGIADGRDVSWIWDADFEALAPSIRLLTCSGTRAGELAVRFKYAGLAPERIRVVPDLVGGLDDAVAAAPPGGRVYALPTYTALLGLRDELAKRGHVAQYWDSALA